MRLALAVPLFALALPFTAHAERQTFRLFTGQDGLSQLGVRTMVQDLDGYLWVGTESGLDRFDGRRFTIYESNDGLSHENVLSLFVDDDGALLVGTAEGLDRLVDGVVENLIHAEPTFEIKAIARGSDGRLWIGTTIGLASWDGFTLDFVPELLSVTVHRILRSTTGFGSGTGELWVGTNQGLWRVEGGAAERVGATHLIGNVTTVTEDREGRACVASNNAVFCELDGDFVRVFETSEASGLITGLFFDDQGDLWVGNLHDVIRWSHGQLRYFGRGDGIRLNNVASFMQDREGRLWVGGFGGIAAFVGRAFTVYDESDGLPSAYVRPLLRDRDGQLWVGTVRGLARWTGQGFEAVETAPELARRYVIALHEDARGRLWMGTVGGLGVRTDAGWVAHPYETAKEPVGSIASDPEGRLWVAQENVGVLKIEDERVERVQPPGNPLSAPRLMVDHRGSLWVSGDAGLSRLERGRWTTWTKQDGLAHQAPYYLAEDPSGAIWFGYHASVGITKFDGRSFRTWSQLDGLADDSVYDIGFDRARGGMWIGSARGSDYFDGKVFRNYGPEEGFPSTESNAGGFLQEPDGRIWFATAEGLGLYSPALDVPAAQPVVHFASVRVGNVTLGRDGLELPARGGDLEAVLDVLCFAHPKRLQLRARLAGSSERWLDVTNDHIVLPKVPPGRYRLEVETRLFGEPWRSAVSRSFVVTPPWWREWWAIAGGVLSVLAIGALFAWWRVRALGEQNERLEAMVRERTSVLEAQTRTLRSAEESLRTVNAELVQANRAKSELLANVSHDLRTPMNGILGMTELALDEPTLSSRARRYLENARASGRTLLELIDELLDLSRLEAGRLTLVPEPFRLRGLLEETRGVLFVSAAERDLELSFSVAPDVPDGWIGDVRRLRRILVNLVGNAIKFTPAGSVTVEVQREPDAVDTLRFRVKDTGIGVPPDRIDAIFDVFTQADGSVSRKYGGTGLGLTISRQLVELMGGKISVESTVGVGSTFTFTVMLVPSPQAGRGDSSPEGGRALPSVASAALDVLVAEDNPVNQLVVRKMLERLGHRAQVVEDGAQAVELAAARRFDLILMDVQMPGLDGLVATQRIRAREVGGRRVPIFALTAHARESDREESLRAGMDGHLTKPISIEALAATLAPIVERVAAARAARAEGQQSQGASPGPTHTQRPPG